MAQMLGFAHEKLLDSFEFIEDMAKIAELEEGYIEAVLRAMAHVASYKGKDLEKILFDANRLAYPMREIENEAMVENEAIKLQVELGEGRRAFEQLNIFSSRYLKDLAERTQDATFRAEQVKEKRKREAEEAKKAGLIPFPSFG